MSCALARGYMTKFNCENSQWLTGCCIWWINGSRDEHIILLLIGLLCNTLDIVIILLIMTNTAPSSLKSPRTISDLWI